MVFLAIFGRRAGDFLMHALVRFLYFFCFAAPACPPPAPPLGDSGFGEWVLEVLDGAAKLAPR